MAAKHDNLRLQIITLHKHTEKSVTEIAKDLKISHSIVSRTISRFRETGDYTTKYENCGRSQIFDERDKRRMKNVSVKNPRLTAEEIQIEIGAQGDCSLRTVQRTLSEAGIKAVKPYRRPFITEKQARARFEWAQRYRHWTEEDWSKVVFSDESVFSILDNCPCYVRVIEGQPLTPAHFNLTRKHPTSVMVWACFSIKGTGRAAIIEGTMDSNKYCKEILQSHVKHQLDKWYPDGDYYFQQDNAPCHKSKRSMDFLRSENIRVLPWPAVSPDINPIENLWSIMKRRLKRLSASSKQAIIANFIEIWYRDRDLTETCKKLVESMPNRVQAVIDAKGYQTPY